MLRPEQWYKNLLVFVAALFSHNALNFALYPKLVAGFFLLCLVSGASYVGNDIRDMAADRAHPTKAQRPLASGRVSVRAAYVALFLTLALSIGLSYWLDPAFSVTCAALFLLNASYTVWLKHVVIVDVLSIAAGFVIRGVAGGVLIPVPLSNWFIYGVFFAALLLALGKRSSELRTLESAGLHRPVLESYSDEFLHYGMTIASTMVIVFYTLYVTLGPPYAPNLVVTVPVVVFIVFRYFYLASSGKGNHERAENLVYDRPMMGAGVLLLGMVVFLLYFYPFS